MIEGIEKGIELLDKVITTKSKSTTLDWNNFEVIPIKTDRYLIVLHDNIPKIVSLTYIEETYVDAEGLSYLRTRKFLQESTGKRYHLEHNPYSKWAYLNLP